MTTLGTGRVGDAILVSRVPGLAINGGHMASGRMCCFPGHEETAWQYTEDSLAASVDFCAKNGGRKIAGVIITSPDNPTGHTQPLDRQIALAHKALDIGVPFVLFDWIYHRVTAGASLILTGAARLSRLNSAIT